MNNYYFIVLPLASITLFYLVVAYVNFRKPWNPSVFHYEGYEYLRSHSEKKGILQSIEVGFKTKNKCDFLLKREGELDRIAKKIKISKEIQILDKEFDDFIYVISDSEKIRDFLRTSDIKDLILSVFYDSTTGCEIKEIRCSSEMLWVSININKNIAENKLEFIATNFLQRLQVLNNKLSDFVSLENITRENSFVGFYNFTSLSVSIFIYGMLCLIFHVEFGPYHCDIDFVHLLYTSVLVSLAIVIMISIIGIVLLKQSSRSHILIMNIFIFMFSGLVSSVYFTSSYANAVFDKSPPHIYTTAVIDKKSVHHKNSTSYYAIIKRMNGDLFELRIDYVTFSEIKNQSQLEIQEHDGYLNYPWIGLYKNITKFDEGITRNSTIRRHL